LAIISNKAGSSTVDFSGSTFTPTPVRPPYIYEKAETPAFPYPPLFNGTLSDWSQYQLLYGNNTGLFYPTIDFTLNGSNYSFDITGAPGTVLIQYSQTPITGVFSWKDLPFGAIAVGPQILAPDDTMPAFSEPNYSGSFLTPQGHGDQIPFTVDGNGKLAADNNGLVWIGNITDKVWHQAFTLIDLDTSVWSSITLAGADNLNTTWIEKNSGVTPAQYITRWKQTDAGNPTNQPVQDYITLSDAADDVIFQNAMQYNISYKLAATPNNFIFTTLDTSGPSLVAVAFIFSIDCTTYSRVDITLDPSITDGVYFKDIDGNEYFISPTGFGVAGSVVVEHDIILQPQVFSLGCWSPCANHVFHFLNRDNV
jgi:hypothetical protein